MLRAYGFTDKGQVRPVNEDCFGIDPEHQLCVVADGLGGHNAGEVAARIAVDAVLEYVATGAMRTSWPFGFDRSVSDAGNLLRTAVHIAHTRILETSATLHQYAGMSTTVVAALVRGNRLSVAHVGDSRLYLYSGVRHVSDPRLPPTEQKRLRQLTQDDSWIAAVSAQGHAATDELLLQHPMRHVLTNVVGARRSADVHVTEERLCGNEVIALTTDGVHGVLDEARIARIIAEAGNAADIAPTLVHAALARGSRDNCTAVVAKYRSE